MTIQRNNSSQGCLSPSVSPRLSLHVCLSLSLTVCLFLSVSSRLSCPVYLSLQQSFCQYFCLFLRSYFGPLGLTIRPCVSPFHWSSFCLLSSVCSSTRVSACYILFTS